MSELFYNPAPVHMDLLGVRPLANGKISFYEPGTTTPKNTYADAELKIPNQNPVLLDASGRSNTNIWLDGAYSVVMHSATGELVWTREIGGQKSDTQTIPKLDNGKFLTNDGSNLFWEAIRTVPDPAGSSNYVLGTDGANLIWVPRPESPKPQIELDENIRSIVMGVTTSNRKILALCGEGSASASGARDTTANVTFQKKFSAIWYVGISQRHNGATSLAAVPNQTVTAQTVEGFTVRFGVSENSDYHGWNITMAVPFEWVAIGVIDG